MTQPDGAPASQTEGVGVGRLSDVDAQGGESPARPRRMAFVGNVCDGDAKGGRRLDRVQLLLSLKTVMEGSDWSRGVGCREQVVSAADERRNSMVSP